MDCDSTPRVMSPPSQSRRVKRIRTAVWIWLGSVVVSLPVSELNVWFCWVSAPEEDDALLKPHPHSRHEPHPEPPPA